MTAPVLQRKAGWPRRLWCWQGWLPLAAAPAVFGAAVLLLPYREPPPKNPAPGGDEPALRLPMLTFRDPQASRPVVLDSVTLGEEAGQPVFRIRAVAHGDELVVDAVTGKLLEVKEAPGRNPPAGPVNPMACLQRADPMKTS